MSNNRNFLPYSISQNYLTSRKTIHRLLHIAGLTDQDTVLEIGAGKGHITRALAGRCGQVISYEIDRALYDRLAGILPSNVTLYCEDFLRCRLPKAPYKVFANIPFSRTTEILRKLTAADPLPEGICLIVEKGAAKRFCGLPRENLNSLCLKPFFDSEIQYYFRREDFHPAPRVDAVLLALHKKQVPDIPRRLFPAYRRFVSQGLRHGICGSRGLMSKRQVSAALRRAGLPPDSRSANMRYVQWLCLFRCWHTANGHSREIL